MLSEVPLNCPHCGAPVQDGLDVCPACNGKITADNAVGDAQVWCASCGSLVPEGATDCPVCGLPIEGAFDEEADSFDSTNEDAADSPTLESALPPSPEENPDEVSTNNAPAHLRLVVVAVIAALLLVGGSALLITRPWDPNAYMTHATEDADTSMEGFPGTVTHLEGQDIIEGKEREAYLKDADKKMGDFIALLGDLSNECAELERPVEEYLESEELEEGSGRLDRVREMSEQLSVTTAEIESLDLRGSEYKALQGQALVTAQYLKGRVDTLCGVWEALESAEEPSSAIVAVKSAVTNGKDGRSLEEWRMLSDNAYATLVGEEE